MSQNNSFADAIGWIRTASGIKFDIFNPKVKDVNVEDIAHSLSRLCRFNGHLGTSLYSVAQHSVFVSEIVEPEFALEGLLHDASESIIGDLISPVKALLPDYSKMEKRIDNVMIKAFGLRSGKKCKTAVKTADIIALLTEARDLVIHKKDVLCSFDKGLEPHKRKIRPWSQKKSYEMFLARFYELTD